MSDQTETGADTIEDLRSHLFATIKALRNDQNPMAIERAKAISDVAQVIINSAKVEVEYLKANSGGESSFLEAVGNKNLPAGVTRHRLKG